MSFSQVGGHPNSIRSTSDGSLIYKPALPLEHEFYSIMTQARNMGTLVGEASASDGVAGSDERTIHALKNLKRLSRFVPEFYGTLTEGNVDIQALNEVNFSQQLLVLSNLLHSFIKPNVLDLKLGTVLYDELDPGCSEDKKARMIAAAKKTTSAECGLRMTAFQVHPQPSASENSTTPVITTKKYGKSIKKEQLSSAMRRVFPVLGESVPTSVPDASASLAAPLNVGASPDPAFQGATPVSRTDLGLPASVLLPILQSIHTSLTHLCSILSEVEMRIIGGSLLVVWEGDQQTAEEGVNWMKEKESKIVERIQETEGEENEGYLDGDDDEEEEDTSSEEDDDPEDTSAREASVASEPHPVSQSEDVPKAKTHRRKPSVPYTISLIDFAHTRFVPGQGPDVGALLGLETFAGLLEGRIREVEISKSSSPSSSFK